MSKIRIYDLAKEMGLGPKELAEKVRAMGIEVKSHSSTISEEEAQRVRETLAQEGKSPSKESPSARPSSESAHAVIFRRREEKEARPKRIKLKIRTPKPKKEPEEKRAEEVRPEEPARVVEGREEVSAAETPAEGKETLELKARIITRVDTEVIAPKPKKRVVKDFKPRRAAPAPPPPPEVKEEKKAGRKKRERPDFEEKPKKGKKRVAAGPKSEREEIQEELELMEELEKAPEGLEMLPEETEEAPPRKAKTREEVAERPPTLPPK
ncbi:MAG: translation initiation factor IF-2, partial [Thermodesulfatator sp.]